MAKGTTANFWATVNRASERLIASTTMLKTKVVLMADGQDVECGYFDNRKEAGDWMAAKVSEWRLHTPLARLRFRTE